MERVFPLDDSVLLQYLKDEATKINNETPFASSLEKLSSTKNSISEDMAWNNRQSEKNGQKHAPSVKLWDAVSKGMEGEPSRANGYRTQRESAPQLFLQYSRKVVEQYLKTGQLREPYLDVTQKEMCWHFRQLLKRRDNNLMIALRPFTDKKWIADRLDALCIADNVKKKDNFSPATFLTGSQRTKSILNQLYSFTPRRPVTDEHSRLYNYGIWRFAINCFLRQQKYTPKSIAMAIGQNLRQLFREKNAVDVLEIIVDQMQASGSIEHEGLAAFRSRPAQRKSLVNSTPKLPETIYHRGP